MHLRAAKGNLVDLLVDEIPENRDGFTVLAANRELATASVLMESHKRTSFGLCHNVELLFNHVNAGGLHGVWVPQVDGIYDKLGRDLLEKVVPMVMLVYVALNICRFLEEQVSVIWRCLSPIDLCLSHDFAPWHHIVDLKSLVVVHANVTYGFPLTLHFVKAIVISSCIVQEN